MSLSPGTRLGSYEIVSPLGAGGMGEVYRARDTKLNREVAIKALPELFAQDRERVARFEREAQLLAALNHPHIAAIYGLEEAEGSKFLVLELVDGQSLAEHLASAKAHALPVSEALAIALQVALALEAAHGKGIIHRDLKPGNIMLQGRSDEADNITVKVLDFGLAKALDPSDSGSQANDNAKSPTLTFAATQLGVILGTAAYMAPEQARGRAADKRADVWAFGCVLYEMLTGTRAFGGDDITDTIAAVVRGEPDWSLLPSDLPPMLKVYLQRCLQKNPKERVQDIGDVRLALQGAFDAPASASPATPASPSDPVKTSARTWIWALAVVLALVGGGAAAWLLKPSPAPLPGPLGRFVVTAGSSGVAVALNNRDIAITPDGSTLIYLADAGSGRTLYRRPMEALTATLIRKGDKFFEPFVSPDGRWIGFNDEADFTLRKILLTGGPPVPIAPIGREMQGASWGPDDTIVFASNEVGRGLWRVAAGGGKPVVLTTPDKARGELQHCWPQFLPGGRAVLFTIRSGARASDFQVAAIDLATNVQKILVPGGTSPRYLPSGHLIYGVEGTLRAVRFDPARLEVQGDPIPVLEGVITKPSGGADFDVAADGTLVYVSGAVASIGRRLVWVDRKGARTPINAPPRAYNAVRISPDGTRAALDIRELDNDIWIFDFARETFTRLTDDPGIDSFPVWRLPDGRSIAFYSSRSGGTGSLFLQSADGSGGATRLLESPNPLFPGSFSPDGSRLVFREDSAGGSDLMMMTLDGPPRPVPLVQNSKFVERNGEVSPDGRWLAYESDQSGFFQVYLRPFPEKNAERWTVSTGGGSFPAWARNSSAELFYLRPDGRLMSVPIRAGSASPVGTPRVAVDARYFSALITRSYDVSPDGKRFLMIENSGGGSDADNAANPVVVLNWAEEIKAKLPPAKR